MLGGAIAGLSFDLHGLNAGNIVMCMLAKIFLMLVFVSIFTFSALRQSRGHGLGSAEVWAAECFFL